MSESARGDNTVESQPSPADLQSKMQSIMQQLQGVIVQMRQTGVPIEPTLHVQGVPGWLAATQPATAALPVAETQQQEATQRGTSPPMDPDRWMSSMLGAIPTDQDGNINYFAPFEGSIQVAPGGGVNPSFAAPPPMQAIRPQQQQQQQQRQGFNPNAPSFVPNHLAPPFVPPGIVAQPPLFQVPAPKTSSVPPKKKGLPREEHHSGFMHPSSMPRGMHLQMQHGGMGARDLEEMGSFAFVEFKRNRIKKYPCYAALQPGQYVIVDGDRGQDCGLLVQINTKNEQTGEVIINSMDGSQVTNTARMKVENGRVLRVANNSEIDQLHHRIADLERVALHACRQRCAQLELNIEVIDCEYQFDLKKVSFFFNSDHSVDFRDLVRELYREFGARIWMENINPNVKNVMPDAPRNSRKMME
jgi:hypothetical protein